MRIKTYCLSLVFLLLGTVAAHSQEIHTGMNTGSRVNETYVDSSLAKTMESQPEAEPLDWIRQLHVKTNALGLGLAIANLAVEVDLAKHWSFTLPVYYSAWDYFKTTVKFRTLMVQPEFRYWFNPENEGWFLGAHFGYGYYNLALDGDFRYQDHNRETPSMGGGIYPMRYDKFYNTSNTQKGLMAANDIHKTYKGIDQAALSLSYTFNLKKKGGKQ